MKIDLKDVTFIIPIRIDSEDRRRNINLSVSYLLTHFDTNIIIKENSAKQDFNLSEIENIVGKDTVEKNITYVYEKNISKIFHRTKILNDMIMMVNTNIVVNYDADIVLPTESYIDATNLIRNESYDLVYPFAFGYTNRKDVFLDKQKEQDIINNSLNIESFNIFSKMHEIENRAEYGFCSFFKKQSYIDGFMENENFISWGPEDYERAFRFTVLGYTVGRINRQVFHIDHFRGINSAEENPEFLHNANLYTKITNMNKEELIQYYSNQLYYKQRMEK